MAVKETLHTLVIKQADRLTLTVNSLAQENPKHAKEAQKILQTLDYLLKVLSKVDYRMQIFTTCLETRNVLTKSMIVMDNPEFDREAKALIELLDSIAFQI